MKSASNKRDRVWLCVSLGIVIVLGLASRRNPGLLPAFLGKYPGDALWALMVFLGWGFLIPRAPTRHLAVLAFAVSCLVELSQLYQEPWLNTIRGTTMGHLVLGSTFSWYDIAAYAVGVLLGVLVDPFFVGPLSKVEHVDKVELKALDLHVHLPLLEHWLGSDRVARWWGSPDTNLNAIARRAEDSHALITANDKPVGYLCWQRLTERELEEAGLSDLPQDLMDVDILIGEDEFLGRGIGPKALTRLLAKLKDEGVSFAGLGTSSSNRVAIKAFEKAGLRLFKEYQDPESGLCKYMVAQLPDTTEPGG